MARFRRGCETCTERAKAGTERHSRPTFRGGPAATFDAGQEEPSSHLQTQETAEFATDPAAQLPPVFCRQKRRSTPIGPGKEGVE